MHRPWKLYAIIYNFQEQPVSNQENPQLITNNELIVFYVFVRIGKALWNKVPTLNAKYMSHMHTQTSCACVPHTINNRTQTRTVKTQKIEPACGWLDKLD